ncbi:MAG: hypothetical protein VX938_04140, partial [Myxococcota bacterium]|nr:hypothetical protein [Myxococcota bacterium]
GQARPTGPCAAIAGVVPLAPVAQSPDPDIRWTLYGVTLQALIQEQGWKRIVLGDKTVGMLQNARTHQVRQHAPDVQDQTLTALATAGPRARLKNAMKLSVPVVFFGDQHWTMLLGTPCPLEKAWERFHDLYPASGGVTYVGNLGLSDDGTQALVYVTWTGGKGSSSGRLAYLKKDGGSWVHQSWVPLW